MRPQLTTSFPPSPAPPLRPPGPHRGTKAPSAKAKAKAVPIGLATAPAALVKPGNWAQADIDGCGGQCGEGYRDLR